MVTVLLIHLRTLTCLCSREACLLPCSQGKCRQRLTQLIVSAAPPTGPISISSITGEDMANFALLVLPASEPSPRPVPVLRNGTEILLQPVGLNITQLQPGLDLLNQLHQNDGRLALEMRLAGTDLYGPALSSRFLSLCLAYALLSALCSLILDVASIQIAGKPCRP